MGPRAPQLRSESVQAGGLCRGTGLSQGPRRLEGRGPLQEGLEGVQQSSLAPSAAVTLTLKTSPPCPGSRKALSLPPHPLCSGASSPGPPLPSSVVRDG